VRIPLVGLNKSTIIYFSRKDVRRRDLGKPFHHALSVSQSFRVLLCSSTMQDASAQIIGSLKAKEQVDGCYSLSFVLYFSRIRRRMVVHAASAIFLLIRLV
jgi:hypothetical protein